MRQKWNAPSWFKLGCATVMGLALVVGMAAPPGTAVDTPGDSPPYEPNLPPEVPQRGTWDTTTFTNGGDRCGPAEIVEFSYLAMTGGKMVLTNIVPGGETPWGTPGSPIWQYDYYSWSVTDPGWKLVRSDQASSPRSGTFCSGAPDPRTPQPSDPAPTVPAPTEPAPQPSPAPSSDPPPPPGYDCGSNGTLSAADAQALIGGGLVPESDPCSLQAELFAATAEFAAGGPAPTLPFGILTDSQGNTWNVVEQQEVRTTLNRTSNCYLLVGYFPINVGARQSGNKIKIEQRICKSYDAFFSLTWVLTDGRLNEQTRTWGSPPRPTVSIESNEVLVGITQGGPGGTGLLNAALAPHAGESDAAWEVQFQVIVHVGLGIPGSQGGFIGFQKSLQRTYRLTVDDLRSP